MTRLRALLRRYRNVWRFAELAFLVLAWAACAPAVSPTDAAHAASCEVVVHDAIHGHDTCPAAELAINASPVCKALYPHGLSLDCPEHRGGK